MLSETSKQVLKYFAVGSLAAFTNLSLFYVLTHILDVYYMLAAVISFIVGALVNYTLNRKYTFQNKYQFKSKQFAVFLSVAVTSLLWNEFFLYIFVEYFLLEKMIAAIISAGLVFAWSFTLHKLITFGRMR